MDDELDPIIHQATRLRVMALLQRNREAPFVWVQETLGLTPGNLDRHVERLESAGYVVRWKALTPSGFQVRIRITAVGDASYRAYRSALANLLDGGGSATQNKAGGK